MAMFMLVVWIMHCENYIVNATEVCNNTIATATDAITILYVLWQVVHIRPRSYAIQGKCVFLQGCSKAN